MCKNIEQISSQVEADFVYIDEFNFEESGSPLSTRDDDVRTAAASEVTVTNNPLYYQMRSLEDLSQLVKYEKAFKCYLLGFSDILP